MVYSKERALYEKEEIGWVYNSKRYDRNEEKQLSQTKFKIGDLVDLSITYK